MQHRGLEPLFPAWQAGRLASVLMLHFWKAYRLTGKVALLPKNLKILRNIILILETFLPCNITLKAKLACRLSLESKTCPDNSLANLQ